MHNKKRITLIIGISLIVISSVILPYASADEFHSCYGYVYIDGTIAPAGIQVNLSFTNENRSCVTLASPQGYYILDLYAHENEIGTFYVKIGNSSIPIYNYIIPNPPNSTVSIQDGVTGYEMDLYINTSPPVKPTNPSPANGTRWVNLTPTLQVYLSDPEGDSMNASFYWQNGTLIGNDTNVAHGGTASVGVTGLSLATKYQWYVNVTDSRGRKNQSDTWDFYTNYPPNKPSGPGPANGSTGVSRSKTLNWTGGDPDNESVTYGVYFGTSASPPYKTTTAVNTTTYNPGTLSYSTKYYWKIVANDNHSATNTSPIWHFTTEAYSGGPSPGPSPGPSGDTTSPTTPTNVQCTTPENDSTPSFSWNASTDASGIAGYYVKINDDTATWVGNVLVWNSTSSAEDGNHTFYVKAKDASSNGNTGNYGSCLFTINITGGIPPVADANGPYTGLTYQNITFDSSDSYDTDGTIVNYTWDFGDETAGYGINPTHAYTTGEEFTVNLTVTDNHGLTNTTTTTANITLDTDGDGYSDDMETSYGTNVTNATDYPTDTDGDGTPDEDSSDKKYTGDTDDDNDNLPDTIENAVGSNSKDPENKTTFVEVSISGLTHYLVDTNNDGTYDAFYNSATGTTTTTTTDADGKYLIDYNGDGTIDYVYDPASGAVTSYEPEEEFPWTIIILIGIVIVAIIILIIWSLFKTGYLYVEEKPKKKK